MVDHPPQPADEDSAKAQERRRLVRRLAVAAPLALGLLVVMLLACVLWIPKWLYPSLTDNDLKDVKTAQNELDTAKVQELKDARLKLQNDARTTLLQGFGALLLLTGAGIGAYVTLRQVRVSQEGLHATREQMQHTLETTRQQLNLTEQGQVTDRYTRAVEQLGHEKAPVRLGALYSLDHLAQDNPQYRQTVVDVVCAYLRMPYTVSAQTELDAEQLEEMALPANGQDRAPHPAPERDSTREELQVRKTAQRLLADHLRCPPETSGRDAQLLPPSPQQAFWPGITLDLTGSTLIDLTFQQVSVIQAQLVGTLFQGDANFIEATFQDAALFDKATFQSTARFDKATFQSGAKFIEATFQGLATFEEAIFQGVVGFREATFQDTAWFVEATFQNTVIFDEADFWSGAQFTRVTFQDNAWFERGIFQGDALFDKATFQGDVMFANATFQGTAWFDKATFHSTPTFANATFQSDAMFIEATFESDALFGMATFQGTARFDKVSFQGAALFATATFQGLCKFGEAHVHLDSPYRHQVWPDGWTIRPDPTDPSRGTLVRAEHQEEPEPAAPRPATPENGSESG